MVKQLDFAIGKKLPLDILMQPVFLGGGRGSGKTSGAKALYEAAHDAGAQCIAIAPTGKWWSLRLGADGKSAGLDDVFVFGGPHADVPLTPESGATVAKTLVDKRVHAVLDVSLMRKGERARFLAAFLEEFWLLKKLENESFPVVVFVEEAHAVVPQRPQPDEARMLGAAEDLVREGRNHGIGVVLLDQRAAVVNKNVLALVEVLLVLRTIHHLDRKTFGEWVVEKGDGERDWLEALPSLQAGEAYLYAPVLELFARIRMRMPRTFNATATAQIGERTIKMGTLTPVDVGALRDSMAQVIAEAEKNDPKVLQRELARLRAELAKKPALYVPPAKPERIEVPVLTEDDRTMFKASVSAIEKTGKVLGRELAELEAFRARVAALIAPRSQAREHRDHSGHPSAARRAGGWQVAAKPPPADGEQKLGAGPLKMLEAVASKHPTPVSRGQLAALSGFSKKGGSFRTYLPKLRTLGLVDYRGDDVVLTQAGAARAATAIAAGPRTHEELMAQWAAKLGAGPLRMLNELVVRYPEAMPRAELAERTGFELAGGSFRTYLPKLRTLGLAEYVEGSMVRASETLFP